MGQDFYFEYEIKDTNAKLRHSKIPVTGVPISDVKVAFTVLNRFDVMTLSKRWEPKPITP